MNLARGRLEGAGGRGGASRRSSTAGAASLQLDPDPAAARAARSWIVSALGDWPDAGVETARLLVTEVVTNAVLHARTPIELSVRAIGTRMRFEIADEHPGGPLYKHFQPDAVTGRGLRLLDSMAYEWGVARTERGKMVWFTLGPDSDAAAALAVTPTTPLAADEVSEEEPEPAGITVVIKELPIAVYLEAAQHNDALMREFAFMEQAATAAGRTSDQPGRLLELAHAVQAAFAKVSPHLRLQVEAGLRSGKSTVDLELVVPEHGWHMLLVLAQQLDEIDGFCEQGELVTLASSPTLRRFRHWYCQQIADQAAGKQPQRWFEDALPVAGDR